MATTTTDGIQSAHRLADLRPGHELKTGSINARQQRPKTSVETLAQSIRSMGLVVPLTITVRDGIPYVIDGNTRLAALQQIHAKGNPADVLVPTYEPGLPDRGSLEVSMVANSDRFDLHPVDRFEVFAKLIHDGATVEQLAARYMLKVPQVRQALALAKIAPAIREAWRNDEISDEAAEAYAQTQDLEHQARIFKKLKGRSGEPWQITREIGCDHNGISIPSMIKFVGKDAYEAAGHQVNTPLFAEDDRHTITVTNVPALKAMVAARIEAECAKLKADGWGWAIDGKNAPSDIYSWRRTPPNPVKDLKANAGCTVDVDYLGAIKIERGYVKPGTSVKIPKSPAEKKAAAKKAEDKKESGGLSQSLCFRLSQGITLAAADALRGDSVLALRIAIASMAASGSPAHIHISGMPELDGGNHDDRDFVEYFATTAGKTIPQLLVMLADWTSRSLSMVAHSPQSMPLSKAEHSDPGDAIFLNALDAEYLIPALIKRFDREDYFASVNRDLICQAVAEALGGDHAARVAKMKKADAVDFAVTNIHKDWLPVELRTAGYVSTSGSPTGKDKPKAAAKAAKPAKAKPKGKKGGGR